MQLQGELEEQIKWTFAVIDELNTIKQSFLFKRMREIATFVDKTAPKGTTRRKILRRVLKSIRIIQTNG